jgi:hypothetical protein
LDGNPLPPPLPPDEVAVSLTGNGSGALDFSLLRVAQCQGRRNRKENQTGTLTQELRKRLMVKHVAGGRGVKGITQILIGCEFGIVHFYFAID